MRPANRTGPVAVVGELDGVHLGHQRQARAALRVSERGRRTTVGVVLDAPERERLLMTPEGRCHELVRCGLSRAEVLRVSADEPADAVASAVVERHQPALVVMACPPESSDRPAEEQLGLAFARAGVDVIEVARVSHGDGSTLTSTTVRELVLEGRLDAAAHALGRPYAMAGTVVLGNQLGRTIGFPTANVEPADRQTVPRLGVYAATVRVGADLHRAAVNIGVRPTVGDRVVPLLEAHLLDVDLDLYGRRITIELRHRVRDEQRFEGLDALTTQLHDDVETVRRLLPA